MFARIFKFAELGWKDLTNIKRWFRRDEARYGFTLESFKPSMLIAKATNSVGQTVCIAPIEKCFVIGAYLVNPEATGPEVSLAGNICDAEIARLAQREGVKRFLIAIPDSRPSEPGEFWIRVVSREVPQPVITGGVSRVQATAARSN